MLAAAWGMPVWAQAVIGASVLVAAVASLWRTVVRPAARAISRTEEMAPVLYEIARQFKPDHGDSLRDVVDDLTRRVVHIERQLGAEE